eukprot:CFRG3919T1
MDLLKAAEADFQKNWVALREVDVKLARYGASARRRLRLRQTKNEDDADSDGSPALQSQIVRKSGQISATDRKHSADSDRIQSGGENKRKNTTATTDAEDCATVKKGITTDASNSKGPQDDVVTEKNKVEDEDSASSKVSEAEKISLARAKRLSMSSSQGDKKRTRRLLGALMGTMASGEQTIVGGRRLSKAKDEEVQRKRQEIERRIEEKTNNQARQDEEAIELLIDEREKLLEQMKELSSDVETHRVNHAVHKHYTLLSNFIQLKSSPSVFYVPAKHTESTLELLQESCKSLLEKRPYIGEVDNSSNSLIKKNYIEGGDAHDGEAQAMAVDLNEVKAKDENEI